MTRRSMVISTALALGMTGTATLAYATAVFDGFVESVSEICTEQPSTSCAFAVKNFLDADGDGFIAYDEVIAARDDARNSMKSQESKLDPQARGIVVVALLVTQDSQLPGVFNNFDTNGDSRLDEGELFADFTLDERPFGDVMADPNGVDWQAFASRFGQAGILILGLLPAEYRQ